MHRYLDAMSRDCWNFANINDIVTYMPPFRGFMMANRVEIGQEEKRSLGRLLKPWIYHTTYDRGELYTELEEEATS